MLAREVWKAIRSLEYHLVTGCNGNLLACCRINTLAFRNMLDGETAEIRDGNLSISLYDVISHHTHQVIKELGGICLCDASLLSKCCYILCFVHYIYILNSFEVLPVENCKRNFI